MACSLSASAPAFHMLLDDHATVTPDAVVSVNLEWSPPWTPEMMSDAARQQLGWMG